MKSVSLASILPEHIPCPADIMISGLCLDSRKCESGFVFFAYPGELCDGRDYIQSAINAGCVAVIYEATGREEPILSDKVLCLPCNSLAQSLSGIAAAFYNHPANDMAVVGVTGTNGKTTCVYLLAQLAQALGKKMGVIGTLGCGVYPDIQPGKLTTPDPITVQAQLAHLRACGCDSVAMEVSSHALIQGRVSAVPFAGAIYTQLSQDHLDYHGNMHAYAKSKSILMTDPRLHFAVFNADCPWVGTMAQGGAKTTQALYYSCDEQPKPVSLQAENQQHSTHGCQAKIRWDDKQYAIQSPLAGCYNLSNLLAVLLAAQALGWAKADLLAAIPFLKAPPARLQAVTKMHDKQPMVYIDYAHTPGALKAVLQCLRSMGPKKLVVVFGCGGQRDKEKRPQMGKVAAQYADLVVLTNDNPRSEQPESIVEQIQAGIPGGHVKVHTQLNRHQAIGYAVRKAGPGDMVLVAGKGHETQMTIADRIIEHHDGHSIQQWLEELV